ncbi:nitroreductase family protein [Labrys portucalensis]|uniref:Nitroreductase family protein n=1 Tax=Labrys neptuniae TaxID=376174 RepID=A0ABV6ZE40_9HYPH|nr:nitroreductase family protein [Labrys neptuniae]MDT3381044.1 nitroreductase family protein [Labrys neptuniae]
MSKTFIDHVKTRRTQYALGKTLPKSEEEISLLIQDVIKHVPSSFNSQSSRAVILFGKQSDKFWHLTKEILRKIVPADSFASTEAKMDSFAAGAGTVLFFEDQDVVKSLQEQFPLYADAFPAFSEQSGGMAQFAVWTALAEHGIGASLQHYAPLVDEAVQKEWHVPKSWKLRAQMPFGSNEQPFPEKSFMNDNDRFKVYS